MDLQTAFYIIGIVFMSLMLGLIIALVVVVFIIRAKIVNLERKIGDKIDQVTSVVDKGKSIVTTVADVAKQVTRAIKGK